MVSKKEILIPFPYSQDLVRLTLIGPLESIFSILIPVDYYKLFANNILRTIILESE